MSFTFPPSPQGFGGQQAGNNPVINMGTADYVFLFETGNVSDGKVHVFKRPSISATWTVVDDANSPHIDVAPYLPTTGNIQFCCWGDSAASTIFLLVLKQSGSTPSVTLDGWDVFSLDTSGDTWNSAGSPVHSYSNGVGGTTLDYLYGDGGGGVDQTSAQAFVNVFVRGAGDYIFYYSGAPETITATKYGRLDYSSYDGVTFSASAELPFQAGKSEPFFGIGGVHDTTNGDDHFFYIQLVGHQNLNHIGLHSGSFGTTQVVNVVNPDDLYWSSNNVQACDSISQPVVYSNGVNERISICGEFWIEPFDHVHQSLFAFTADVAENPVWTANVINTGIDNTSFNTPSVSNENIFPVPQGIVGFPQQALSLAVDASSHELSLYWTVTDTTTFLGHVFGAISTDDGATWAPLSGNILDALDLVTDDNAMVEVYAWAQAGGGIGVIASQLAISDFSQATQYASTAPPPPTPPTCSLASVITGSTVTLTWTTMNTPTSATIDQGIGAVDPTGGNLVLPLPGGSTTYHLLVSNTDGSSTCQTTVTPPAPPAVGGCRTILMLWQGSFVSKPETTKDRFGDWDDGGTNHLKFYQGFRMKADTFGQPKIILVRDADAFTLHNIQPATVQHSGEVTHAYSFETPFYAHQVRDEPQDLVSWRRFGIEWVFELAPENVRTWQTQRTAHGIAGYQHISRIEAAWSSTADVTLTVSSFDGQSPAPLTLPSTGGVKQKILLTLTPNKGTLYTYRAISTAPFQLWLGDWVTWVGAWNRQGPYMPYRNLGGTFGDDASI